MSFERHDPKTYGIHAQLVEARREVRMRERVYERWVDAGTLDPRDAAKQLAAMMAIVLTLERLDKANQGEMF
jgi:hypothetical protein